MAKVKVNDMNVLAVYVTDLEMAKAFYIEQLGFEECEEISPGILLRSGDVTLYMEAGRKERKFESREFSEFSPCFATDSVKQTYEVMKSSGVKVVEEYQEYAPTFALFKITDPDGNLIEIAGKP
ncbi:MAG: VOC family protein [Candidatus Fermentibacteraceae bacterium]|nr:VOC family protein [Candidatus Fermentibacteraceae bacterium]